MTLRNPLERGSKTSFHPAGINSFQILSNLIYLHVSVKQKASATRSTLQALGKLSLRAGGRSETKTTDTANIVF